MKLTLNEQFRRMQKLAGIITENLEQDIVDFWGVLQDDAAQSDGEYEAEWENEFFIYEYPEHKGKEQEINSIVKTLQINEEAGLNKNFNFDYQERKAGDVIVMDDKTMDDILDDLELQDYINPKSFTRNNKGEIVLGVDHMDYEQFDKLAKFLGIKY